jgi:chromosome segregation ATPase
VIISCAALAALLSCAGCIVTQSTYNAKVREVETLRDAYASSNRETSRLAGEVEALSKQVAGQKAALQELSSRADACEAGRAREKRESAERDRELAELLKKTGTKEEPAPRSTTE